MFGIIFDVLSSILQQECKLLRSQSKYCAQLLSFSFLLGCDFSSEGTSVRLVEIIYETHRTRAEGHARIQHTVSTIYCAEHTRLHCANTSTRKHRCKKSRAADEVDSKIHKSSNKTKRGPICKSKLTKVEPKNANQTNLKEGNRLYVDRAKCEIKLCNKSKHKGKQTMQQLRARTKQQREQHV